MKIFYIKKINKVFYSYNYLYYNKYKYLKIIIIIVIDYIIIKIIIKYNLSL